jgi:hypothetical protein
MYWHPMELAPQNGRPFIYLRRLTVIGGGKPPRYEYTIEPLHRFRSSDDSPGYWRNAATSVPDSNVDMSRGWWCHSLPVGKDGAIRLPPDFETAPLPCDSGSDPKGENSRSEVECEASQSGGETASPNLGQP